MGKCSNGFRPIPRPRALHGKSRPGLLSDKRAPDSDAETLASFAEHLGRLSKTREDVKTWFEFGELDDYVSFGGKA